ncbi:multicystatin-like isoform X1 [Haliotis rufescens]|uniref:multicystatin-like isoform X1 n=1 Tax=Haliotis rufescens TaxID=6454 RepID=UPI00201E8C54|nr:multicystatin-like isoform X1 [Haliotis rufescens]
MNILALVLVVLPLATSQLIGGPVAVDVNRDDIQQMASFALTQLNTLLGSQNTLVSVVDAKTQVVSGVNYLLTIEIQNGQQTQICTVTIWSRAWLNDKRVTHHACTTRSKRAVLVGAPTSVDVNRTDIQRMATFAVTTLNGLQGAQNSLDQVISAKTQVVAGTNYILKIRLIDGTQTQICDLTIWDQPWTHMTKLTHHSCTTATKRNGMPGGLTNVDVNSLEVLNISNFALGKINGLQGAQNSMEQIISAKTQVVAGVNYVLAIRIKEGDKTQICNVKVWSQPWLNKLEMTQHSCTQVTKRALGLLGGVTAVDVNSAEIKEVANFAVTEINGLQGEQNSLVKVVNARKQIVSGINYILTLSLQNGDKTQMCEVRIWYQSWTNTKKVTEHKCSAVSKRGLFVGGVEPANLTAPVQQAVSFVEDALNGKMNNMFRMVTEKVDHVTQQVVAGMKYSFDLHLVTSSCMNNDDSTGKGITDCPASNSMPQRMACTVSVWYQAWNDPKYQLVSDSCGQLA